jgi:hypothetical protein
VHGALGDRAPFNVEHAGDRRIGQLFVEQGQYLLFECFVEPSRMTAQVLDELRFQEWGPDRGAVLDERARRTDFVVRPSSPSPCVQDSNLTPCATPPTSTRVTTEARSGAGSRPRSCRALRPDAGQGVENVDRKADTRLSRY